jgi:hypothetical protein
MKRAKEITKKKGLFIEELERPALAMEVPDGKKVTTLAIGEEAVKTA